MKIRLAFGSCPVLLLLVTLPTSLAAQPLDRFGVARQANVVAAWYWPFSTSESYKQLQAANERVAILNKSLTERDARVKELDAELKSAKAEIEAAKEKITEEFRKRLENLEQAHKDELVATKEVREQRIAALQTEKSELQMRQSQFEREIIALKGALNQPERLAVIQNANFSMERTMWVCLSAALLSVSGVFAWQYFDMRAKRRDYIVQLIAQH